MDKPQFLNELNDSQRSAVEYNDGPSLVIAGAGSGKTRVLTYKIAYLLTQSVKPWEIMALTFTNKAAREMKERIATLVGENVARYLVMGTFHSVFARILRSEATHIGYSSSFTIYDESDSRSLCKAVVKELGLDEKAYKPADVHFRISEAKNRLMLASDYENDIHAYNRDRNAGKPAMAQIYKLYSQRCRQSNAMDFDDLLLNMYLLLKNHPDICQKYANNIQFFLVDEYQDTNYAQQQIVLLLASAHKRVCVVGDDAQSIYGFRGANIDNILDFTEQYGGAKQFKLEQNYRSTQCIVNAANSLIHHNERQIRKVVFSENEQGDNIQLRELASDKEEAMFVCNDIRQRIKLDGTDYGHFAILYRTNYQSRAFEEQMMKQGIPYKIYGGMSFYQRKEIKDIVAYFRVVVNPDDEEALKRIINYPARGIGDTTINKVIAAARESGRTIWQVIEEPETTSLDVNKGTLTKLNNFRAFIEQFMERLEKDDAFTLGKALITQSGISKEIYSGTEPEDLSRQENLEEFMGSMQDFVQTQKEQGESVLLVDFLHDVALLTDRDEGEEDVPKVSLMTVHSSKGLEFQNVYVVGMEENIFPSAMCIDSMRELEEERRLLYVAITRAEKRCTLSYARSRFRYGKMEFDTPSRFLREIDSRLISGDCVAGRRPAFSSSRSLFGSQRTIVETPRPATPFTKSKPAPSFGGAMVAQSNGLRPLAAAMRPSATTDSGQTTSSRGASATATDLTVGCRVLHDRFGKGTITDMTGSGDSAKATVVFDNVGTKQLLLKFAKLMLL